MKTRSLPIILFLFTALILSENAFAQDSTETKKHKWEWDWEFEGFDEWFNFRMPSISIGYGLTDLEHKKITDPFSDVNLIDLKLGHTERKTSRYSESLLKYSYDYLFLDHISSDLAGSSDNTGELNSKTWRVGFGHSKGFGYRMGQAAIIPYYTTSFEWSKLDFTNPATNSTDQHLLDRFEDGVRFGTSSEGGMKIVATSLVTLEVGYERTVVFERHLFWKWAGSGIIEAASQGLLDVFIKEIMKSSPAAGPVVYFVLKSALGYGIYELRQDKMNWPFKSSAPLSFDSFKFGLTFTF
ncbi:MAG: hypothetical protein P8Y79_07285 [Ignavibacteriaceae bacterium]